VSVGKNWLIVMLLSGFVSLTEAATLTPTGPVQEVFSTSNIGGHQAQPGVAVSGSADGFLVACADSGDNLDTIFYNIGSQSWGTVIQTSPGTTNLIQGPVLLSNTTTGAMVTWLSDTIGYWEGQAFAGFTDDEGSTWSIIPLENTSLAVVMVGVSGTPDGGFMFVWYDPSNGATPYWVWATYNGSSWVTTSPGTITTPTSSVSAPALVSGTIDTGFMATWIGSDNNAYASYTNNQGGTWTTQQISTAGNLYYVWIGENANGFMAVWADNDNNAYSSFYDFNTSMWSSPTFIASNLASYFGWVTPYVTGSDDSFVATWIGNDSNAYATLSTDNGATWNSVQITSDGSIANGNGIYWNWGQFVGASIVSDTVLFTWADLSGNAQSRFYTIQGLTPPIAPPATLTGSQMYNNLPFQRQSVNNLVWTASPSSGVVSYNIYRGGSYLATVSGGTLVYNDLSITAGVGYTYGVTSVNSNQEESSAVTVYVPPK